MYLLDFNKFLILILLLIVLMTVTGCQKTEFQASWCNQPITIDGDQSDWQGRLVLLEDQKMSVGCQYDSSSFYLCLIASRKDVKRMVMGRGLIVSFKAKPGKDNSIGLKYPLGIMGEMQSMNPMAMMRREREPDSDQIMAQFQNTLEDIKIRFATEKEFQPFFLSELNGTGLSVMVGFRDENLVYEMKIPLTGRDDRHHVLSQLDVQSIQIEVKIPEIDREAMKKAMSAQRDTGGGRGGPPGGGMGGRSPRGGGMGGRRSDMGHPNMQNKKYEASFIVHLRTND